MLDEVVNDLFLLAILEPKDVAGTQVGDDGGIPVVLVELELVDHDKFGENIGFFEGFAVRGVFVGEHFLVDGPDGHLVEARDQGDLLVVEAIRQKAFHVIKHWLGDLSAACLERDGLHHVMIAIRTFEPMFEADDGGGGRLVERKVAEPDGIPVVFVHKGTAFFADTFRPVGVQITEEEERTIGRRSGAGVDEAIEAGRDVEEIQPIA